MADEKFQNNPFASSLKEMKKTMQEEEKQKKLAEAMAAAKKRASQRANEAAVKPRMSDEEFFAAEMRGVKPLGEKNYVPAAREAEIPAKIDDETEALIELADLVAGAANFDFNDSSEYIEGIAVGLDKRLLKKLRQGLFAVQAHLDLHGRSRIEARELVEKFIIESRQQRRRTVLIIHGRGLNSKDNIPVLKENLKTWLAYGKIARSVLAFCSAQANDGGTGAVYVLLRK